MAIMLPEAKESNAWQELAFAKLRRQMHEGVYPDGAYTELTPGYHYWVMHDFETIMLLARKNGVDVGDLFTRHEKMYEFLMHISTPTRGLPRLADAGAGLTTPDAEKLETAMATGALLYNREDMRYLGPDEAPDELIWHFSPDTLKRYATMPAKKPAFNSHMMPYAQYGMMRTGWDADDRFLLVDYAPFSGPHTHCDQLQVILYSRGRDLLVDPGTCGYHDNDRHYYLSNAAHNVLLVDGKGISRQAHPEVLTWELKPGAEFTAAKVKNSTCMQQRSVLFVKPDYWVVVDHVSGDADAPTLTRLFHLPPGDVKQDAHAVRTRYADGDNIWLHAADGASLSIREGLLSADADGNKNVSTPVAVFESQTALPAALCTVLVPFADEKEIPAKVERVDGADSEIVVLRIAFGDGRTDWIAVAPTERGLKAGSFSGKGMALCGRIDRSSQQTAFEVFGVTPLAKPPAHSGP